MTARAPGQLVGPLPHEVYAYSSRSTFGNCRSPEFRSETRERRRPAQMPIRATCMRKAEPAHASAMPYGHAVSQGSAEQANSFLKRIYSTALCPRWKPDIALRRDREIMPSRGFRWAEADIRNRDPPSGPVRVGRRLQSDYGGRHRHSICRPVRRRRSAQQETCHALDRLRNRRQSFKGAKALDETLTAAAFITSLIPAMAAGTAGCCLARISGADCARSVPLITLHQRNCILRNMSWNIRNLR